MFQQDRFKSKDLKLCLYLLFFFFADEIRSVGSCDIPQVYKWFCFKKILLVFHLMSGTLEW